MSKKISLKQYLMQTGKFEKVYDCVTAIKKGRVTLDNKVTSNPNYFFNPKKSLVKFDDEKIKNAPNLYFLMNKPSGYLSQKSPNEKSIYHLLENLNIPGEYIKSLSAVGRLDKDTEGLLILTNDGKFSNAVMRPENEIIKKYCAVLDKPAETSKIKMLEKGIEISIGKEKYRTKPCKIKAVGEKEVYISISEGKKRQIRKMFESVGNNVVYLKRVSIGGLSLGELKEGEIKQVTKDEIMEKLNS